MEEVSPPRLASDRPQNRGDNLDAAEAFAEMVDAKALALPARPEMYRVSKRVPNAREMVVHRNYLVFYRVSARFITILRIKHARQQWPKA